MNSIFKMYQIHHTNKFIKNIIKFHNCIFKTYPIIDSSDNIEKETILRELKIIVENLNIGVNKLKEYKISSYDFDQVYSNEERKYKELLKKYPVLKTYMSVTIV